MGLWVSQQRDVKKPSLGGSVVDMIVNDKRVQIKSSMRRISRGPWKVSTKKMQRGHVVSYSQYDFDFLIICLFDPATSVPKYIYEIPMSKLVEMGIVCTTTSKGTTAVLCDPELKMNQSRFHCLNECIVWSHINLTDNCK
eukprot:145808_1